MNYIYLLALSFMVGIMVVVQGGLNARLGVYLNNPLLATSAALSLSALFTIVAVLVTVRQLPSIQQLKVIPLYLWFTGAIFSFIAVSLFYYLIPKLGISTAVSFGLCGQIMFSMIAANYGWFGLPIEPIAIKKVIGTIAMMAGIFLIKF
ncbi:MAG: DMT family transporter [bacterium]|nr:DMT family transporter [bacterium]